MIWQEQVGQGLQPWIAKEDPFQLFVQPWYGDGMKYRGIIKHPNWTLTINKSFDNLQDAQKAVEDWLTVLPRFII